MKPSPRKPIGIFAILALITLWSVLVAGGAGQIARLHWLIQLILYALAGTIWVLPFKPLLRWMEREPE